MKRVMFSLILALLGIATICAQDHIKFMGIPVDGNITNFQTKLLQKGFKVSELSKYADVGTRVFEGQFTSENATVAVYYNNKLKNLVHGVRVIYDNKDSYSDTKKKVESMVERLETKYGIKSEKKEDTDLQKEKYTIFISTGWIYVWMQETERIFNQYSLFIQYDDYTNGMAGFEKDNEDL
ncbi:MAG: hypothetical protein MJZ30_00660 [Paludibacteraceae bacterium]|nr:hypothetical protein [Paludibacteraceae bacterium]